VSREAARSGGDGDVFYVKYFFRLSPEDPRIVVYDNTPMMMRS